MKSNKNTDRQTRMDQEAVLNDALVRRIVRETAETVPPVSGDLFSRIEAAVGSDSQPDPDHFLPKKPLLRERIRLWLDLLFRPQVGWGLAAVQAVALCLFLVFSSGGQTYNTLSMSRETTVPGIRLYVMFDDTATVGEIEELLRQMHGRIIDGPAGNGIYTIAFVPGTATTTAGLLDKLQHYKIITFAEQSF